MAKVIYEKELAQRIEEACNLAPQIPEKNFGRLGWIQKQMLDLGHKVSEESVRKWISGEARPRARRMQALAKVLGVDEAWLAFGNDPYGMPATDGARSENVDGAPNYVAGLFALNGVTYGWASNADNVHFHAIVRGNSVPVFVTLAVKVEGGLSLHLPIKHEGTVVLALVKRGPMEIDIYHVSEMMIAKTGRTRGGHIELKVQDNGDHLATASAQAQKVTDPTTII